MSYFKGTWRIDAFFAARTHKKSNSRLISNLTELTIDHLLRLEGGEPLGETSQSFDDFKTVSAIPLCIGGTEANFKINRTTHELFDPLGITNKVLLSHIVGKSVTDIGPGASPFLNDCRSSGASRTVAFDINRRVVKELTYKGHEAYCMNNADLNPLPRGSMDVVHSSYAVPFTCRPKESILLANDCIDVVE